MGGKKEADSRQGDESWVSSAHNSTVQALERGEEKRWREEREVERGERRAFRCEPPAANFPPKYNCSLISKALDSGAETTTNRFMRRTVGWGRRREVRRRERARRRRGGGGGKGGGEERGRRRRRRRRRDRLRLS